MTFRIDPVRYAIAPDFRDYLASTVKNAELWAGVYRTATVAPDLLERAQAIPGRWHLLALSEDWCGDAVNTLPVLARYVEQLPAFDLRVLGRDTHPDLMDAHLSQGARAIPVVMIFDTEFVERGWWGSRPAGLQEWVRREGHLLETGERYRHVRRWYARDRGRSMMTELLTILERVEAVAPAA